MIVKLSDNCIIIKYYDRVLVHSFRCVIYKIYVHCAGYRLRTTLS